LDAEVPFPQSKEKLGRFVGIAENTGDALTFLIYTEDTEQVIARSVIRTAEDPTTSNKRVDQQYNRNTNVANKVIGMKDIIPNATLTVIDPDSLIGYSFVGEHAGSTQKVTVNERLTDTEYEVQYADGNEGILTYEEITNFLNHPSEDGTEVWTFQKILDHKITKQGNGKQEMKVKVLWDTGEETWEPLDTMKKDDPVTIAQYVQEKGLKDKPFWKWANRYLKNPKRFIRMTRQVHLANMKRGPKYKFGVQVPRDIREALALDKVNKNTIWFVL
jgi:hypothetical protein